MTDDERLPRARRVRASRRIREILAAGDRAAGSHLLVVSLPNDLGHPRLCAIVGKKVSKRAVRRNRVKRLVREAFRRAWTRLPARRDYVVIALARDVEWTLPDVERDLLRGVARLGGAPRAGGP